MSLNIIFTTERELGSVLQNSRGSYISFPNDEHNISFLAELLQLGLVETGWADNVYMATPQAAEICRLAGLKTQKPFRSRLDVVAVIGDIDCSVELYRAIKVFLVREGLVKRHWLP